jgi:ADP-ribosylglycohydrolase
MSQLLKTCVDFTGDVDTIAAIAAGAASCSTEILQDTPENLILTLENGKYGKDFITELDGRLIDLINA